MRELLAFDLCGMDYGVWRDEIADAIEVRAIHRLPRIPSYIAGIAIVEHRTAIVADLSVCIGLSPAPTMEKKYIFTMPDAAEISGFAVGNKVVNISVPDDAVLPVPSFLRTDVVQSAVVVKQDLIPVINIAELYRILQTDGAARPDFKSAGFPHAPASDGELRLFMSNGEIFALPSARLNESVIRPARLTRVALAPDYFKGMTLYDRKIMPVSSLAELIKIGGSGTEEIMIPAEIDGEVFGLLVDRDEGTLQGKDCTIMPLPLLARQGWMKSAAVCGREIIPVIEVLELIFGHNDGNDDDRLAEIYSPSSSFETVFGRKDVEVVEFSIFGVCYALPKAEVLDIISIKPFRALPMTKSIVVGVSEYDGELLPVLDLGVCFNRRSAIKPDWKMIVVTNGNFRALVVTEAVLESKLVEIANERELPILLPHGIVYGCYVDASDVRVILNIEAMAVCIDWTSFSQMTGSGISEGWESLNHELKREKKELMSFPASKTKQEGGVSGTVGETEQIIYPTITEVGKEARETSGYFLLEEVKQQYQEEEPSYDSSKIEPAKEIINETGILNIETVEIGKSILLPNEREENAIQIEHAEINHQEEGLEEPRLTTEGTRVLLEEDSSAACETAETMEVLKSEADELHADREASVEIEESGTFEIAPLMTSPDAAEAEIPAEREAHADIPNAEENRSAPWDIQEAAADVGSEPLTLDTQESQIAPLFESAPSEDNIIHEEIYTEKSAELVHAEAEEPLGAFILKDETSDKEFPWQPEQESMEQLIPTPYEEDEHLPNPYNRKTEMNGAMSRNTTVPDVKLDPATLRKILQKEVKEIENPKIISEKMRSRLIYGVLALILLLSAVYLLFVNKSNEVKREDHKAPIKADVEKPVEVKPEAAIPPMQPMESKSPEQQEVKKVPAPEASSHIKEMAAPTKELPKSRSEKPQVSQPLKMTPDKKFKDGIYLVKPGDTLWDISEQFTGDPYNYDEVAEKNSIEDPDLIFPGQKIKVRK